MQVVGITTQQEIYAASKDRRFKINEILVIEDGFQGELIGEVVETSSYNRFIPLEVNGGLMDARVLKSLEALGYDIKSDTVHIGKIRLLAEADYPVETGAAVRPPRFHEVKDLLIKCEPREGLVLGVIKSTGDLEDSLEDSYRHQCRLYIEGQVMPQQEVPFIFPIKSMQQYPHIGIFGGSGSGKSFCMRVILEELMKLRIPVLVLDPHFEMDFSQPCTLLEEKERKDFAGCFSCYQVGSSIGVDFTQLTKGDLKNLLSASGGKLSESMENVVETLYRKNDSYQTFSDRLEMLAEAKEKGENILKVLIKECNEEYLKYRHTKCLELLREYPDLHVASVNGVLWRLKRLYNDGLFNYNISPVISDLGAGKMVVIQGPIRILNVFSAYLLGSIYRMRRDYKDAQFKGVPKDFFPPFVVATDEAHNFAPKGTDSPSKGIFKEIAQEGRKYGVFLALATQRPALLDETITAQLNSKFVFRTVRGSDIATIKEETDLTTEESRRLPYLRSGDCFVSSAVMGRTIPVRIRLADTESPHTRNPFDELENKRNEDDVLLLELIRGITPISNLAQAVKDLEKLSGGKVKLEVYQLKDRLEGYAKRGLIQKQDSPFGSIYL